MAGWTTNGEPIIQALVENGVTTAPAPYTNLDSFGALIPCDTEIAGGQNPQTVAVSPFDIASSAAALIQNTATSTAHTATLNTRAGLMLTEALTTAAGADYTFQIVNSLITSTARAPQVQIHDVTNTAGAVAVNS